MDSISVSIIVPTYESPGLLSTLQGLQNQTAPSHTMEILVVGQQTGDWITHFPNVRYVHVTDRPTAARNRNQGAACARGKWLCFTDSDCVPEPDWVQQLIDAIAAYDAQAFYGHVTIPADTTYWGRCDHLLVFDPCIGRYPHVVKRAATLNFCIERDLFFEMGGFDEAFPFAAGEDLDFNYRLQQAGHSIYFIPAACVEHRHSRQTLTSAWGHIQRYGEANAQFRLLRGMDWRWRLTHRLARLPELVNYSRSYVRWGVLV